MKGPERVLFVSRKLNTPIIMSMMGVFFDLMECDKPKKGCHAQEKLFACNIDDCV